MSSAGQQLVAGRIPGERITTSVITSDSADFTTTEIQIASFVVPVVSGRNYDIRFTGKFTTDSAPSGVDLRLYEDSLAGTLLDATIVDMADNTGVGFRGLTWSPFTASATENVTFVVGAVLEYGSGPARLHAGGNNKALFTADYVSG